MDYKQILEQAKIHGLTSEKKMWSAVQQLSCDIETLRSIQPELYWRIIRNQHGVIYERHYSEKFANYDVNKLVQIKYDSSQNKRHNSPHWTLSQIIDATKELKFHPKVNDWDKYVAFNSMYTTIGSNVKEDEVIKVAYLFYFCDEDWQDNGDCTKIWDCMSLNGNM